MALTNQMQWQKCLVKKITLLKGNIFNENRKEIIELVKEMSFELGDGMIEFVASFNCFKDMDITIDEIGNVLFCIDTDNHDEKMIIKNGLTWFAGEEVARHLVDQLNPAMLEAI